MTYLQISMAALAIAVAMPFVTLLILVIGSALEAPPSNPRVPGRER